MIRDFLRNTLVFLRLIEQPDLLLRHVERQLNHKDIGFGDIVLVGNQGQLKWAVLRCPGDCETLMRLPLSSNRRPYWSVSRDWLGRPSLSPSIHQRNACRAHFWIKKGAVTWCRDSRCGQSQ